MPAITVEGPKIENIETKRNFVKELTGVAAKAYGLPEKIMVVLIKENPPENVGVGGQLILDKKKD